MVHMRFAYFFCIFVSFSLLATSLPAFAITHDLAENDISISFDQSARGLAIFNDGLISVDALGTAGVIHNDTSGSLLSSLIVDADVDPVAAIVDTKLATISTAGKVANSATTGTDTNIVNAIVSRDSSGNFSAGTITASLNGNATTATTTTSFSGSLVGDVTGTQSATVVSAVGSQTASNVAAAAALANAATNANTASAIVKRDSSGNFSAGAITASLSGNATTATTATNFSGSLVGDVTGTQGATVVSAVGSQTATNVAAATALANAATNANTASTIVKRDSTGSFAAQVVSVVDAVASSNLVLSTDPSTSTTGNILKGANRFIHNTGISNTFVGVNAGNFTTSGTGQNSAFGVSALTANTTGANNTALGYNTLNSCTTGSSNVVIGSGAGTTLTTGSNNIYIKANPANESNTIRIGFGGTAQTACFIEGIGTATVVGSAVTVSGSGQLGVVLSSQRFKHDIQDMDVQSEKIFQLRPVTFVYNSDETKTLQYGLIAEEANELLPAIVMLDKDAIPQTVHYHMLPVLLLNEFKKQHVTIGKQQVTIEKMNDVIDNLRMQLQEFIERIRNLENKA